MAELPELEGQGVINTIKGIRKLAKGKMVTTYYPVGSDGQPLTPPNPNMTYNIKGEIVPHDKDQIVDIEV